MEGSVQRSDSRLRITAQLIDATGGHHLWAERFGLKVLEKLAYGLVKWHRKSLIWHLSMGLVIDYRLLAWYHWSLAYRENKSPRENIAKAFRLAQKALSMDGADAMTYALLGSIYLMMRQYEKAIAAGERSVELDPNGAMVHGLFGNTLSYAGRPDGAITHLKQGIRLNPFPEYWYFHSETL